MCPNGINQPLLGSRRLGPNKKGLIFGRTKYKDKNSDHLQKTAFENNKSLDIGLNINKSRTDMIK